MENALTVPAQCQVSRCQTKLLRVRPQRAGQEFQPGGAVLQKKKPGTQTAMVVEVQRGSRVLKFPGLK